MPWPPTYYGTPVNAASGPADPILPRLAEGQPADARAADAAGDDAEHLSSELGSVDKLGPRLFRNAVIAFGRAPHHPPHPRTRAGSPSNAAITFAN
jgi:hypothetical protein